MKSLPLCLVSSCWYATVHLWSAVSSHLPNESWKRAVIKLLHCNSDAYSIKIDGHFSHLFALLKAFHFHFPFFVLHSFCNNDSSFHAFFNYHSNFFFSLFFSLYLIYLFWSQRAFFRTTDIPHCIPEWILQSTITVNLLEIFLFIGSKSGSSLWVANDVSWINVLMKFQEIMSWLSCCWGKWNKILSECQLGILETENEGLSDS